MKLWVDDIRPAPSGYDFWSYSVNNAKDIIKFNDIQLIDIDHDAGDYAYDGGDYIKLLDWLEETGRNIPIRIHSMNHVGVQNMRMIINKNGCRDVR